MKEISPETSCFICKNRHEDVRQLALQASKYPDVNMAEAVVQIAGWQIAEKKIPLWAQTEGVRYPQHLSMEQCSSEVTARYKASLVKGDSFADLTAGLFIWEVDNEKNSFCSIRVCAVYQNRRACRRMRSTAEGV